MNLRDFFMDLWDPDKSEYLRSRQAETGRTYSNHYIYNSRHSIEDYFLPCFESRGIQTLDKLTHKNLLEWRNALLAGEVPLPPKRQKSKREDIVQLSPVTVNKVRQAVWVGLNWAVEMGYIKSHPGSRVKRVSKRQQKLSAREVRAKATLEIAEAKRLFKPELWKTNYSDDYVGYAAALFCFNVLKGCYSDSSG